MRERRTLKNKLWEARLYAARISFSVFVLLILTGVLIWRYYDLQITRHQEFTTAADRNRIHVRAVAPASDL